MLDTTHSPDRIQPVTTIEAQRRALRLSQVTLAERCEVSRAHISSIERGLLPKPSLAAKIADALGVTRAELWPQYDIRPGDHPGDVNNAPPRQPAKHEPA